MADVATPLSERLRFLIEKLDALGSRASLFELADALKGAGLTLSDLAPFVDENPRHYNRALIALSEHYELLAMTWRPGQASPPHDHAGSICVMQVMQGDAVEETYGVSPDGYADFLFQSIVPCGEVTAGQDAGVHAVSNRDDARLPLVTVHLYAPPLKDFRRFIPRPSHLASVRLAAEDAPPTIVVVGGGFSGTMAAAQLLTQASKRQAPIRVGIVERRGAVGEGIAYSTRNLNHLLNVPAGRMSAWPDRPDDFWEWARRRDPSANKGDFLPRQWYGEYVRESLAKEARACRGMAKLFVSYDEVRRIARRPDGGWLVYQAQGGSIRADAVVLAVGHRPPSDPIGDRWSGPRTRFIADPWQPFALNLIKPDESVVVLGTGLTAVDAVLSLVHARRSAPITILSRRGLLPQSHAAALAPAADLEAVIGQLLASPQGVRSLGLLRLLRSQVRETIARGGDWRSVIDGVRPYTARIWHAMSTAERKKFIASLQPYWEVHRHRMALSIGQRFGELNDCDWVHRITGRVVSAQASDDEVRVAIRERRTERFIEINASWVINCTGPSPSNSPSANPAIGSLLVDGWLRRDELGLGVDTTDSGNAMDEQGRVVGDLFVIGTLRKPALWESSAVPELRTHAAVIANELLQNVIRIPQAYDV